MKLLGEKRAYFASLLTMIFSVCWSVAFFCILIFLFREWLLPALLDFFQSVHIFFKNKLGVSYGNSLYVYFVYIGSVIALFLGMKFGFRGSKQRKLIFFQFSDGLTDTKTAFLHHYRCYGLLDLLCSMLVTLFLLLAKSYVGERLTHFFPHITVFEYLFSASPFKSILVFICASLLLALFSLYGVYSSHRTWCADILYDME